MQRVTFQLQAVVTDVDQRPRHAYHNPREASGLDPVRGISHPRAKVCNTRQVKVSHYCSVCERQSHDQSESGCQHSPHRLHVESESAKQQRRRERTRNYERIREPHTDSPRKRETGEQRGAMIQLQVLVSATAILCEPRRPPRWKDDFNRRGRRGARGL